MSSTRKRNRDNRCKNENVQHNKLNTCILHRKDCKDLNFIPLSRISGKAYDKLIYLQNISEKRLSEPLGSPIRMVDICNLIPKNLQGIDLDTTGYH